MKEISNEAHFNNFASFTSTAQKRPIIEDNVPKAPIKNILT